MRMYVKVTGILFALLVLAHVARLVTEDAQLASDPFFLLSTLGAAVLAMWAWRVLRRVRAIGA